MMKQINLNEEEFKSFIKECVTKILSESLDENMWNSLKGAYSGAINGFRTAKSFDDTSKENRYKFSKYDTQGNLRQDDSYEKDAAKEASRMYKMAIKYQRLAANLYSRANALSKYANLEKIGKGDNVEFRYKEMHSVPSTIKGLNDRRMETMRNYKK